MSDEPELQADDLEERLKTTIRRAEVALLLIRYGFPKYLPTILEDLFCGTQMLLDIYCVTKNPNDDTHGTYDYLDHNHSECG